MRCEVGLLSVTVSPKRHRAKIDHVPTHLLTNDMKKLFTLVSISRIVFTEFGPFFSENFIWKLILFI